MSLCAVSSVHHSSGGSDHHGHLCQMVAVAVVTIVAITYQHIWHVCWQIMVTMPNVLASNGRNGRIVCTVHHRYGCGARAPMCVCVCVRANFAPLCISGVRLI